MSVQAGSTPAHHKGTGAKDGVRLPGGHIACIRLSMTSRAAHRRGWLPAALLVGAVYFLVGRIFALPSDHVHAWRLAAWIVSGAAYASMKTAVERYGVLQGGIQTLARIAEYVSGMA